MKHDRSATDQAVETVPVQEERVPPALLFEMMRSFIALARTLNLSHAVKELGSTRQTLRRHISLLEDEMGARLFSVDDRRYTLTDIGTNALPEAINLVARGTLWVRGTSRHQEGLPHVNFGLPNGWTFRQQQHPLSKVWTGQSVLMRETLRAWCMSGGRIEGPELAHVRRYLIVYRQSSSGWITVEFGEDSFYVKWFGWAAARSSIGRTIGKLPGGPDFAKLLEQPFEEVTNGQTARLDHISTQVPKGEEGKITPVSYARLMMGGQFPDQSQALFALIEPLAQVEIEGVDPSSLPPIPADVMVNFDKNFAKFEQFQKE